MHADNAECESLFLSSDPRESAKSAAKKFRRTMSDSVKLIECPRDAWQGLQEIIPADLKVNYLKP